MPEMCVPLSTPVSEFLRSRPGKSGAAVVGDPQEAVQDDLAGFVADAADANQLDFAFGVD